MINHSIYRFSYNDVAPEHSRIESLMGFRDGAVDDIFKEIINEIHREIGNYTDLKAELRIFEDIGLKKEDYRITVDSHVFNTGKIVFNQLKRADKLALVICTAGKGISAFMKQYMEAGDTLRAYTIDIFGSEIVESAMDLVQEDLRRNLETEGIKITNRYSPGYCGWNVIEQHRLFELFPGNFPGISLNSSALMNPVKSVSCIIGTGPDVRYNSYSCGICDMKDCIYRERKPAVS